VIRNANTDLLAGTIGLGLSLLFWFSIDREIMRLSIMFPKAMILIMALISVLLVVKGFMKADRQNLFDLGSNLRVSVTGMFFFAWGIAIVYLGFFTASVLAIFTITAYLATARRKVTPGTLAIWLVIVICEVAFFYLIFTQLLHVPLPQGFFI
jgi:hypothetical protein